MPARRRTRPYPPEDANTSTKVRDDAWEVEAFASGVVMPAPPLHDPDGPVRLVEHLFVASGQDRSSADTAVLESVSRTGAEAGAVLTAVIGKVEGGQLDPFLQDEGVDLVGAFHVRDRT
jgi:hypothetical protein